MTRHAFTLPPKPSGKPPAMKCPFCSGNAIARAICIVCYTPLCMRHTVTQDGKTFCKNHKQGYL